ncbi:MAG: PhzF family phenazine biosynthesis protein [Spirochaetaceae bacterium]|jgi:PhzF family phenazine biosynthesis protein|nr:PhzF family phenazine biosynthesis protein [Spirochaetaceae bacterium]
MNYFVVDAFAETPFTGNPAGVYLSDQKLNEPLMQRIAMENNLAETAFPVKNGGSWDLRWFTPETEIDLCGHATLATAFILSRFVEPERRDFTFNTASGILHVTKKGDLFEMDFPSRKPVPEAVTPLMRQVFGDSVLEAYRSRDIMLVLPSEAAVRDLRPNMALMMEIPNCFGVIVTAKAERSSTAEQHSAYDFVSRYFAPDAGIPEDPVTGSSHCTLIPFWAERLGKTEMTARQLSSRGGTLYCKDSGERVLIAGKASLYLQGEILL